jgi:hypothetical protein
MAANEIAGIAFERAWRVYRLLNSKTTEDSERHRELEDFIQKCCAQGATDTEAIVVLALIHLKQLDEEAARRAETGKNRCK